MYKLIIIISIIVITLTACTTDSKQDNDKYPNGMMKYNPDIIGNNETDYKF
jgi:hypothetical protein